MISWMTMPFIKKLKDNRKNKEIIKFKTFVSNEIFSQKRNNDLNSEKNENTSNLKIFGDSTYNFCYLGHLLNIHTHVSHFIYSVLILELFMKV